ncbi:MAG TPA: hypothetical protein VHU83_09055 [Bryobacteraceae bacterium]|jgi:hypothetical protein|nr:hypothetical protein [Bryobacteraceae bacterium]
MNENGHTPVTKADLESALEHLFKRVVEYVDGRVQQLSEHFDERIYDTETKLLRGFREFNEAQDVRLRKLEANLGNLDISSGLLGRTREAGA